MGKWRALVLIAVHVIAAVHIVHWRVTGRSITPVEPSEAMAFAKANMVNAGLIFFAATVLLTLVFGRYFCGWGCHLVAIQDLCLWLLGKLGIKPRPLRSRLLALVPALAFAYMFLWPVAYRLWVRDSFRGYGLELTTTELWSTFPGWVVGILTFLSCGFAIVYFLGAKGFCTYACPYGAIFGAADKLSPLRIRVSEACNQCGHCSAVCTSNVKVAQEVRDYGMVVDSGCMKCRDCVSVCPTGALSYGFGPISLFADPRVAKPARASWPLKAWEELLLAASFAAAFFTFRGLYGAVPFLMSLGVAGILAYLVLATSRLLARADFKLPGITLRQAGSLRPAGRLFLVAIGLLALFWLHSGWLRWLSFQAERSFAALPALEGSDLDPGRRQALLSSLPPEAAPRAVAALEQVERWSLLPTLGLHSRLASALELAGQGQRAEAEAKAALAAGEQAPEMRQLLARLTLGRGDLDGGIAWLERGIADHPASEAPYLELGSLLARSGRLQRAAEVFDQAIGQVPNSPQLLYNRALVHALAGQTSEAIDLLEKTVTISPDYLAARENLAGLLASQGRWEESVGHYRRALSQAPGDLVTHRLLARALLGMGDSTGARGELEEVLRLSPGDTEALSLMASMGR
ncbi:MAG: tetratricopeptide repeat protein [Thermoanaerobaculia bacterium]